MNSFAERPSQQGLTISPTLFFASVKVDATRISRDVGSIANEIIHHLASLPDSEVEVTLEIQARVPGGVTDNVVRTVSENCRTLKFRSNNSRRNEHARAQNGGEFSR